MPLPELPRRVAIVGGGVIGGGWAARFLLNGCDVSVFDLAPDAGRRIQAVLDNARASLPALSDVPLPSPGNLIMANSIETAVSDAEWIQESVSEDLALKHRVLGDIERYAPATTPIGSSTSGFKPSELRRGARHPERILVAHPFNPVYLLPLVEIVGGTDEDPAIQRAKATLLALGMKPLLVRQEIDAHIADRFLEAVWREALWLINDDVATTEEIDDAIRFGFGLRWAQMGLFETYRLAGGEAGMAHFIEQFGPALAWPWTKLMDVPELSPELIEKIAAQSDTQSGSHTVRELEAIRDRNLVGILRALKERDWGAGAILNEYDKSLTGMNAQSKLLSKQGEGPLRVLELTVLAGWIDYNGHMTEYRYAQVFSDTCDRLLLEIGMDADYVASGYSYYTVESHIMNTGEASVNEPLYTTSQIVHADAKRLHVFHRIHAVAEDRLLATAEQMYLHVNRETGRVCEASEELQANIRALANAHADLPRPDAVGRYVGQRQEH